MAKRSNQPQVRKSVFIFGGIAVGVALLALVVPMVMGGGGGTNVAAPSATPGITRPSANGAEKKHYELHAGGRDPFKALLAVSTGAQAPAATPTPAPEAPGAEATLVEVLSVENGLATIRIDSNLHENVKSGAQLSDGFVLEAVEGECAFIARSPERFRVCAGERFLK